ncbi:MAG: hypothetical protein SH850_19165 [Planctomycetaceae bacterium]|nr:hypothetical protein [Planctomycetaceae bacterium]
MVTRLKREGAELLLPIDAELLEKLGIDEQTELQISAVGQSLVLTVNDEARRQQFQQALDETNQQFGRALRRLAE